MSQAIELPRGIRFTANQFHVIAFLSIIASMVVASTGIAYTGSVVLRVCTPRSLLVSKSTIRAMGECEDEVDQSLQRAKELLDKAKAKMATKARASQAPTDSLPFFACLEIQHRAIGGSANRDTMIIKAKNEETGLVIADGEKMAEISEREEWERRGILDVFQNEIDEDEDVYSLASQQLASRDVAASIWNLRKSLQQEDYQKIFDKKNIFIGEDT